MATQRGSARSFRPSRRAVLAGGAAVVAGTLVGAGRAVTEDGPVPQLRGLWVATVDNTDWPSKAGLSAAEQRRELIGLLDFAAGHRLNAVFLQVRPAADAFWPSPCEPWSTYLTGTQGRDPGWDPLGTAVAEAHARDLELHAWCNPYRVATGSRLETLVPEHPARRNPEWVVRYGGKLYYNPGMPEVRAHVQEAVLDAVRRYPVDGLHFDDYFYPYPVKGERFDDDAAFAAAGQGWPDRDSWRRHNTDLLISELHGRLRRVRPQAAFGISPFGVWRNRSADPTGSATSTGVTAYDDLHADVRRWVREGWIDYVAPQLYWNIGHPQGDYAALLDWWARQVSGTRVRLYIGEAAYRAGDPAQGAAWQDPAELSRHLALCAGRPEVGGNIFYNATAVHRDRIGAFARLAEDHYQRPAPAP